MEKDVNAEVKAKLQLLSGIRKINFWYPRGYRPLVKKGKDNTNSEHRDETPINKAKSHNSFSTNQPQIQASKKDKRDR